MKCVVTGGAGFIGSHIVDRLVADGHQVAVIDNESADAHDQFYYNKGAYYAKESVQDYNRIEPLFRGADTVFHLAAESRIQPTIKNPMAAVISNALGTTSVLMAAVNNGIKRVVYSSTSAAYGEQNEPPFVETMCSDCLNPYSITKVCGENFCRNFHQLYGMETVTFRYFNVYGERQPLRGQYAPVVGLFQRQHEKGEPMTVVGDGTQTRDFTHVSDVVEANILAATLPSDTEGLFGEVFNIGTGKTCSVLDLAEMVGGKDPFISYIAPRPGEIKHAKANNKKAKEILGWSPKVKLAEWVKENTNSPK